MSRDLIMIGVSGGVDSSVSAWLLARAKQPVAGLFMQNWEEDERFGPCRAVEDRKDALATCALLGIPFHARNFAREYWDQVFEHFLAEYRAGRTPNPDVLCNREIKFKTFLEHARELGAERIATGHYARNRCLDGRWQLLRGLDENKDQSYFLHALGQEQLAATLFPVGELHKTEVRRIAAEIGLPNAKKKDSTGICFIGERPFREFLNRYIAGAPGPIKDERGRVLGEPDGRVSAPLHSGRCRRLGRVCPGAGRQPPVRRRLGGRGHRRRGRDGRGRDRAVRLLAGAGVLGAGHRHEGGLGTESGGARLRTLPAAGGAGVRVEHRLDSGTRKGRFHARGGGASVGDQGRPAL